MHTSDVQQECNKSHPSFLHYFNFASICIPNKHVTKVVPRIHFVACGAVQSYSYKL